MSAGKQDLEMEQPPFGRAFFLDFSTLHTRKHTALGLSLSLFPPSWYSATTLPVQMYYIFHFELPDCVYPHLRELSLKLSVILIPDLSP